MINISLIGERELVARFANMPAKVLDSLYRKTIELTLKLEGKVKLNLSGIVLNVRTGALRRSIFSRWSRTANSVSGKVASSGDVKYARIHELGGTINHPGGTPYFIDASGQIRFVSLKSQVAALLPKTKAHKIVMPKRAYMAPALASMRDEVVEGYRQAVLEGMRAR